MTKSKEIKYYKELLTTSLHEIKQISKSTKFDRQPVQLDQTSIGRLTRMDQMQTQAMQIETQRRRKREINLIKQALGRIERDVFGECVLCGEEIEAKRLEYNPTILNCFECAKDQK